MQSCNNGMIHFMGKVMILTQYPNGLLTRMSYSDKLLRMGNHQRLR